MPSFRVLLAIVVLVSCLQSSFAFGQRCIAALGATTNFGDATLVGGWLSNSSLAQTTANAIAGEWILNKNLSDPPPDRGSKNDDPERLGDRRGDRGGFGDPGGEGNGRRGRRGQGRAMTAVISREAIGRLRDALNELLNPPERLTITTTETMIILASPGDRTTRLAPNGKKIKEENSGIERRTSWNGQTLVSEMTAVGLDTALGLEKITETYSVDPDRHQLHVSVRMDVARRIGVDVQRRTVVHVYDANR